MYQQSKLVVNALVVSSAHSASLKYPTFEVGISYFHGQNEFKIRVSDLCGIHTKSEKNINIGFKVGIQNDNKVPKIPDQTKSVQNHQKWSKIS